MSQSLRIESLLSQCEKSQPSAPAPTKKLHYFIEYDPKANYRSNQNWSCIWKTTYIASMFFAVALQGVATYFVFTTVPLYIPLLLLLELAFTYVLHQRFSSKIESYVASAKNAQNLLERMNKIQDKEIPAKLQAIGVNHKDIHQPLLEKPEKIKLLLALYSIAFEDLQFAERKIEQKQEIIEVIQSPMIKFDGVPGLILNEYIQLKWAQEGYKTPFDSRFVKPIGGNKILLHPPGEKEISIEINPAHLQLLYLDTWQEIQKDRLGLEAIKDCGALSKVKCAFILKTLQNPYEKSLRDQIEYHSPSERLSAYRIVASKYGEKDAEVILTTKASDNNNDQARKYIAEEIFSKSIPQLAQEIFGFKVAEASTKSTSSWFWKA